MLWADMDNCKNINQSVSLGLLLFLLSRSRTASLYFLANSLYFLSWWEDSSRIRPTYLPSSTIISWLSLMVIIIASFSTMRAIYRADWFWICFFRNTISLSHLSRDCWLSFISYKAFWSLRSIWKFTSFMATLFTKLRPFNLLIRRFFINFNFWPWITCFLISDR